MKIQLFTHSDLDGIGCAIVGILAFGKENIDIIYCDYDNINEKVENFYIGSEKNDYDMVFITDISVNEDVAKIIEYYKDEKYYPKIKLLDHHPTALNLNKYSWCNVIVEDENGKLSGTKIFYDYILNNISHKTKINVQNIKDFVENVRQYDTWEWKTKFNNEEPKQWNDLLYIMGREEFVNQMIYKLTMYDSFDFNSIENMLLRIEENKKQNYFQAKQKEITIHTLDINNKLYAVGIVFAEQYLSELGNVLATNNKELDFIMIISSCKTISYRTVKNIDLGKDIASAYGGGGHPKAAGSQIAEDIKQKIINLILD